MAKSFETNTGEGDFIAVIELLRQLGKSLKENGGAASDYQKTLKHLESTLAVLESIPSIEHPNGNTALLNAIRGLAYAAQGIVRDALKEINKYDLPLGHKHKQGWTRGVQAKIKWAQLVSERMKVVSHKVEQELRLISPLLAMHHRLLPQVYPLHWSDVLTKL